MIDRGWCQFATQHRGTGIEGPGGYPEFNANPANPQQGRDQNYPLLFVDHRMGGYKRTLDDDPWRHANNVGVTAGIGRDGSLDQYTSIFDAHWGNGVSGDKARYDRANAALAEIEALGTWVTVQYHGTGYALVGGGVNTINSHSISTEFEDENKDQPWTDAMIDMAIRWKRWCLEELEREGRPMPVRDAMLAGHFQIDAVNRPGCPGDYWPRGEILAGIMEEDDVAAIQLIWNPDFGRLYVLGQGDPRWVTEQSAAAELQRAYGQPTVALSWVALQALGAK